MTQREKTRKWLKVFIIAFVAVIIVGYGTFQFRNLVLGPRIWIASPIDGEATTTQIILVSGTIKNAAFITFNGAQIFTDENGAWSDDIVLMSGYNVLTLVAKDRFGKVATKILHVIYTSQ
ncbi:MAG TPA: hypothetical protein VMR73_01320 [Candidatus Paceibacterota bacterium]|nr:hypothetical protein [Candidatus Paceibacterota bacterium]